MLALFAILVAPMSRATLADIYPDPTQAQPDLTAALQTADATHRRILIDFGGNWCPDCHALDLYFHDPVNKPILEANYVLVHVNIGRWDKNTDIAERYQIPIHNGVPALAVLDSKGKLIYSQATGQFRNMRDMQSAAVTDFLNQWKASPRP